MVILLIIPTVFAGIVVAQKDRPKSKRAKRPDFSKNDESIFFDNIFKQALKGTRPKSLSRNPTAIAGSSKSNGGNSGTSNGESSVGTYAWSKIIEPSAIESEVKAIKIKLDQLVTTPGKFRSGGYQKTRIEMTVLAMLFAIISEYDGDVRWKKVGLNAREAFAKCAANCSVGTQQSYAQAKNRKTDLQDILNGGSVTFTEKGEGKPAWEKIVNRTILMNRLETSYTERIKLWTASQSEFNKNIDALAVEANLVAAIGEVLSKEGMKTADEESYVEYAAEMKKGALAILAAIQEKDAEGASKGAGVLYKACNNCHDEWQ